MSSAKTYDFWLWIAAALILRLVLMFTTAHSDMAFINYLPARFAYEKVVDIYGYLAAHPGVLPAGSPYPPFTYFEIGCFQWVLKPVASGFHSWICRAFSDWYGCLGSTEPWRIMWYVFLMKVPYLFYDALCLWGMTMMFRDRDKRLRAAVLWLFNPVVLYGVYMFGQIDIMPSAVAFLGVVMIESGMPAAGFALLAIGALFKTFPLFMIPILIILVSRDRKDVFKYVLAAGLPLAAVFIPYAIAGSRGAWGSLWPKVYAPHTGGVDAAAEAVRAAVFLLLYFLLAGYAWLRKGKLRETSVLAFSLSSVLLLYVLFFAPIHYFVWAAPLLVAALVRGVVPRRLYWGLMALLFVYGLNSARTTNEIFAPLDPGFFLALPSLPDMLIRMGLKWGYVMAAAQVFFVMLCVMTAVALAGESPALRRMLGIRGN